MNEAERDLISLFEIGNAIHQLNKKSERKMGLSLVQWRLLKCLIDMPATSAYLLSQAVGVHPSTLTQTLKRLEKKEMLFVSEDPRDSRRKIISITRAGKEALSAASDRMVSWSQALAASRKELAQIQSCLKSQVESEL